MSQGSADFASPKEDAPQEVESGERAKPVDEQGPEPLDEAEALRLIEDLSRRLGKLNLTPQERHQLERRRRKLESFLPALRLQRRGAERDNDAVRRTDDFEAVFGATLDDDSETDAPMMEKGLPPASPTAERHSNILSAHLREAKQGGFEKVQLAESRATLDAKRVDAIDARLKELNAAAMQIEQDHRSSVSEAVTDRSNLHDTLKAARHLLTKFKIEADDAVDYFLNGKLPERGWFRKQTDSRFLDVRKQLREDLERFAHSATRGRLMGYNVPVPDARHLESAGLPPVPPLPEVTPLDRAKEINAEFLSLKKERALLMRKFTS